MQSYETVVGLEIHAHLKTDSKMFCSCGTGPKGKEYKVSEKDEPNIRICPICSGQPGTLPVPNRKAIEDTILLGLALGSKINPEFNFERKNYYYPDLPKAYQITSATNPPVIGGGLEIEVGDKPKLVELDHIHLEEDAGKLTHPKSGDYSLVDLNRAGTPLLEIITKPILSSGQEAVEFMKNLQSILRYLGISDADMEKGQMRCDANISVRKARAKELGVKVEIKNMNSFKMIEKAICYEAKRQAEALEEGEKLTQETRGWDDNKGKTTPQRSKEFANDYRYFPEPDIPPIKTGKGTDFDPEKINDRLPELPKEKKARFIAEYGLSPRDAHYLSTNYDYTKYYEEVMENIPQIAENTEKKKVIGGKAASFMITEYLGKIGQGEGIFDTKVTPRGFSELVLAIEKGEISGKIAKEVFAEMMAKGGSVKDIIGQKGYSQISNETELNKIVVQVLEENQKQLDDYKSGKAQLFGYFVGQVMAKTKGQANPKLVNELLKKKLGG
jgi:aspartyl-tRNA(Asn)/glutamyl-tRNA(Gln) amidotransferase subunit B